MATALPVALPDDPVDPVQVSGVRSDESSISFEVDRTGQPVLVRTSYFPNWSVTGADGPYRVAPNLMVVVPTDTTVELVYGRSGVELVGLGLTLLGIIALAVWRACLSLRRQTSWRIAPAKSGADLAMGQVRAGRARADSLDRLVAETAAGFERRDCVFWLRVDRGAHDHGSPRRSPIGR